MGDIGVTGSVGVRGGIKGHWESMGAMGALWGEGRYGVGGTMGWGTLWGGGRYGVGGVMGWGALWR